MSDEPDIVNLDDCPMKPGLVAGGAVAFVLTVFPMSYALCCLPLALGGFVATTTFVFKYKARLELKYGMKIAILACLLGFGASTVVYNLFWLAFDYRIGFEWYVSFLTGLAKSAAPPSGDRLLESIELLREQSFGIGTFIQQIFTVILASGIGGAIGGALATVLFKKGALAQ